MGSYYRPIFPILYSHLEKHINLENIQVGDNVKVLNVSGSPLVKIGSQLWYAHGQRSEHSSEEAYKPDDEIWS